MDNQGRQLLTVEPHPLLDLRAIVTVYPDALGNLSSSADLLALLSLDVQTPLQSSDEIRAAVRDLLRHGGFKPTGRSKPASEYLIKVTEQGAKRAIIDVNRMDNGTGQIANFQRQGSKSVCEINSIAG